jgi:hypothetical protein
MLLRDESLDPVGEQRDPLSIAVRVSVRSGCGQIEILFVLKRLTR